MRCKDINIKEQVLVLLPSRPQTLQKEEGGYCNWGGICKEILPSQRT